MDTETIKSKAKDYILREFLPGDSPDALTDSTPLVTGGILSSLGTLKLVSFLEDEFDISLEAHEVDAEHLDTLDQMAALVLSKKQES